MKLIPSRLQDFHHICEHNWLIHDLMINFLNRVVPQYASGFLVDIGCGQKPYESIAARCVSQHIGLDVAYGAHDTSAIDVVARAAKTGLRDGSCDTVLCTEVFEHLEEPSLAAREIGRILKQQGVLILTVPFFWPVHEAPRDLYRYSEFGLRYLFEQAGFEIVEIRPMTGYVVTFAQLSIYFLKRFQKGYVLRTAGRFFNWGLQHLALKLNRYDRSTDFTNLYGLVARKIEEV